MKRLSFLLFSSFLVFLQACSFGSSGSSVEKDCVLPDDQSGTIAGRWPVTPAPVNLSTSGNFSQAELNAISAAAESWNSFYNESKGFPLLDFGGTSGQALPSSACTGGILSGGSYTGSIVIYKVTPWPSSDDVIALTQTCPVNDNPLPRFTNGYIELNYENYFVSGQRQPDMESLLLHEFGHLIGLKHSCEGFSISGTPNCNDSGINPDYLSAVMFPALAFNGDQGQVKRALQSNDQGRANCLY